MNMTKRLLSLLVCFIMVLTGISASQIMAYAGTMVTENIVSYLEPYRYSTDDITWTYKNDSNDYLKPGVDASGDYMFTTIKTNAPEVAAGTEELAYPSVTRDIGEVVIGKDDTNRTEIITNNLNGKYKIELELETLIKNHPQKGNSSFTLAFKGEKKDVFLARVRAESFEILDNASAKFATYKRNVLGVETIDAATNPYTFNLDVVIDTNSGEIESYFNGSLMTKYNNVDVSSESTVATAVRVPITKLYIQTNSTIDVGSYFKIKDMKITQISRAENSYVDAILDALPDALVSDVNNATETSVILDAVDGVEWSSLDETSAMADGNTLNLFPSLTGTKEARVKASFKIDDVEYSKVYSMTLAQDTHTVNYYDIDGNLYETAEVREGETTDEILAPERANYSFAGWYEKDSDIKFDFTKGITADTNLYARYEGAESNVVFVANGDTVATLTGKFGDVVKGDVPEIPAKPGYTAIGWYIGNTDERYTASTTINSTNMIVNAKYAEGVLNTYTVNFKADGEVIHTSHAVEGYAVQTVPSNPEKANYTFGGWTLNGAVYDMNAPVTSDITLEALFAPDTVKVNFYMDETMSELYTTGIGYYDSSYGTLPIPTKDTYIFLGWKNNDGSDFTADQILTGDISVYAEWEYSVKVVLDEDITKYTTLSDGNVEFIGSDTGYTNIIADNGIKLYWYNTIVTDRSVVQSLIAKFKVPMNDEDTENRTRIYNSKLVGDYEVEVTADYRLSGKWDSIMSAGPYGFISTGYVPSSSITNILQNRLYNVSVMSLNASSAANNTFNDTNTKGKTTSYYHLSNGDGISEDDGAYMNVVTKIRYNTATNQAKLYGIDNTPVSYGPAMAQVSGINGFSYKMMTCFNIGDYIRVKNVKVTQYNVDVSNEDYRNAVDIVYSLPETIVADGDDPYNVTQNLTIPTIKGVTWLTSDLDVVSSKGIISRWYDPQNVTVTARVQSGSYEFIKEYKLTIAANANIKKVELLNETFTSEDDISNWTIASLADGEVAGYTVDENGFKIYKTTAPNVSGSTVEEKRYFAFYDLYKEVKSDAYTSTATRDVKGVYDAEISLADYTSTSNVPVKLGIGYRNGTIFYPFGTITFNSTDGVKFTYKESTESTKEISLGRIDKDSVIKIRVDNILGEIAIFLNGKTKARVPYCTTLGDININTIRAALDVNNEIGDGIALKGIKFEQLIANPVAGLDKAIAVADSITIDDITSNPDAVSGKINDLPETVNGYRVDWKSSSSQIDTETGEVFHDATAKTVILTAEIYDKNATYPVTVRKTFRLTVRAALSDEELGQFHIGSLGRITNQRYDDIRYDLNLPDDANVTWTSSNTDIIGNDGMLNDTATVTEPTKVTITAESKGVTKDYVLTVSPRTTQVTLASGNLPLAINFTNTANAKVSSDVITKFTYTHSSANTGKVNILDDGGNIIASMVTTETGIYFDYKNSDYKEIALADGISAEVEILAMPCTDKIAVWVNGKLAVDYADFKTKADYIASVETTNMAIDTGAVSMTVTKYGMLTANTDNFDYFTDARLGYALAPSMRLPKDVISSGVVTWTSDSSMIDGTTGAVTEPATIMSTDLEFRITDNSDSRIFISRNFKIAVDCNNSKNIFCGIAPSMSFINSSYPARNATDNDIMTTMKVTNTNKQDSDIIFSLGSEKTLNSMFIASAEGGIEEYEIYKSNDGLSWTKLTYGKFGIGKTKFIEFDTTVASYIKLVLKQCSKKDIMINEIKAFLSASEDELALIDLELITVPASAEGDKITLPSTGANGTPISWSTSDSSIIDTNGNVTRPSTAKTVTLTATVMSDGKAASKTFDVYVDSNSINRPTQVGGGSGGGGGSLSSAGISTVPVIGGAAADAVYAENLKQNEDNNETYPYADVKTSDWYYDQVKTLTNKGIVSGDGSGYFHPNANVTREQFVKMILEAMDVEIIDGKTSFTDVESGAWYENYIATAEKNTIIKGLTDAEFGIGSNITRQDMAVLIERVLAHMNIEVAKTETEAFADADEISTYAAEAVTNMKAMGLIQGYNNMYNPKDNLTRAEAAAVIASLLELLEK